MPISHSVGPGFTLWLWKGNSHFPQQSRSNPSKQYFHILLLLKTSSNEEIDMLLDLVKLLFFNWFWPFRKSRLSCLTTGFFSVLNYSCAENFPVGLPTDWTMALVFSYSIWEERHHSYLLLLTTTFWPEARRAGSPCQPPPQVAQPCSAEVGIGARPPAFRWCWAGHRQQAGVVQQEPRWGTASASWQPQCRNSSGGRGSSSLAYQLQSNLHTENPGLQAPGGHNPSSLTCCRDWSSSGHFWNPAAAIWDNLHKQERRMYRWLQA